MNAPIFDAIEVLQEAAQAGEISSWFTDENDHGDRWFEVRIGDYQKTIWVAGTDVRKGTLIEKRELLTRAARDVIRLAKEATS